MHSTQSVTASKNHGRTDVTLNMHITPYTNLPLKLSLFIKVRNIASDFIDSIPIVRIHCVPVFISCFFFLIWTTCFFLLVSDLPQRNCMEGIDIVAISEMACLPSQIKKCGGLLFYFNNVPLLQTHVFWSGKYVPFRILLPFTNCIQTVSLLAEGFNCLCRSHSGISIKFSFMTS